MGGGGLESEERGKGRREGQGKFKAINTLLHLYATEFHKSYLASMRHHCIFFININIINIETLNTFAIHWISKQLLILQHTLWNIVRMNFKAINTLLHLYATEFHKSYLASMRHHCIFTYINIIHANFTKPTLHPCDINICINLLFNYLYTGSGGGGAGEWRAGEGQEGGAGEIQSN